MIKLIIILTIACIILAAALARTYIAKVRAEQQLLILQNNNSDNRQNDSRLFAAIKENLEQFRQAYTDAYTKETEKRAMLQQQLNQLFQLNHNIGDETRRLSEALRGNNAVQGQWGEMILENILSRSGLIKGQDYLVQKTVDDPDSNLRPDVIIRCPDSRNIVVDSKASLTDYLRMLNAPDRQSAKSAGEAHVASVKKHIATLRRKNYSDLLGGKSPDFVLMFIPHEGAFLTALQLDDTLWQTAFDSHVIIVSPTHLTSVVRLVEMLWRQDKQNRNAIEIAALGSKIIDKLNNFLSDMAKIKNSLDTAQRAYDSAMTRLDGKGGIRSLSESMTQKGIKSK